MQINFETLNLRQNVVSMKDGQQVIVYVKVMLSQIKHIIRPQDNVIQPLKMFIVTETLNFKSGSDLV